MKHKHLVFLSTLFSVLGLLPTETRAEVTITAPSGTVYAVIGHTYDAANKPLGTTICFNTSSGWYGLTLGGTKSGMNQSIILNMTNNSETIVYGGFPFSPAKCLGNSMRAPISNGWSVVINGSGGNDSMWGPPAGGFYLAGDGGNDYLYLGGPGWAFGAAGNDSIRGHSGTSEWLLGGDGSDCIDDADRGAQIYNCGAGQDTFAANDATFNRVECETPVSYCP